MTKTKVAPFYLGHGVVLNTSHNFYRCLLRDSSALQTANPDLVEHATV